MHTDKTRRGVIFLTLSGLIVKFAGLFFKIPLTALIGEEGMGLFNSAYTLFSWFYTISTAGLPTASALLVSRAKAGGRRDEALRVLRISMLIFLALGLVTSGAMLVGADAFARLIKVESSRFSMLAIAPTLLFVCQSAALRGYFQGLGMMLPHAISQVAEALGKLILGLMLARAAIENGAPVEIAAAYAALGLTLGVGLGMVILLLSLFFTKNALTPLSHESLGRIRIAKTLTLTALPITLASGLSSLSSLLDAMTMTRKLHSIGFSQSSAAAIWGNYSSLAIPMYNLPPILIYPLTYALMPRLAAQLESDVDSARESARRTLELTAAIAIPSALGLAALSEPILGLLFEAELASRGAPMLTLLAPSSFMLCLLALTNTMLQVCSREKAQLIAIASGSAAKLISAELLIPILGAVGTPISTLIGYALTLAISVGFLESTPLRGIIVPGAFIRWFAVGAISVAAAVTVCRYAGVIAAIAAAGALFAALSGRRLLALAGGIKLRKQ